MNWPQVQAKHLVFMPHTLLNTAWYLAVFGDTFGPIVACPMIGETNLHILYRVSGHFLGLFPLPVLGVLFQLSLCLLLSALLSLFAPGSNAMIRPLWPKQNINQTEHTRNL